MMDAVQSVMAAKEAALQFQVQMALLRKQLQTMEQQGQMMNQLLQKPSGVAPDRGQHLDTHG